MASPQSSPLTTTHPSLGGHRGQRVSRRSRTGSIGHERTKPAKKTKERQARRDQGDVSCIREDALLTYIGWSSKKAQSASNGHTSGLRGNKLENDQAFTAVGIHFIQEAYTKALLAGKLPEFQAKVRSIADHAIDNGPLDGTWMDIGDAGTCNARDGSKACAAHPGKRIDDFRDCRKSNHLATFLRHVQTLFHEQADLRDQTERFFELLRDQFPLVFDGLHPSGKLLEAEWARMRITTARLNGMSL
jgi:hypothetical protein